MEDRKKSIGQVANVIEKVQGDQKYLFGTIGSDKIKNLTFVPVIEYSQKTFLSEETKEGYQRPGSQYRMRAFAKFLKEHPNSVVPPVLLSGRGNWEFESKGPGLGELNIEGKAAIIDGQHRLGGFVFLYESEDVVRNISFILLPELTISEEKTEFLIVNNSQKGVPRPLTSFLEDKEEAQVGWGLNEEIDSPFHGRITRTTLRSNQLFALHSLAKNVKRLFSLGVLQDLDVESKIEFMSRYWVIIADQLPDAWSDIYLLDDPESKGRRDFRHKLLELTGLVAWSHTGAHIFFRSYSETSGMNWENVIRLVEAASGIDWSKEGEYRGRTGEAGGKLMSEEMIRLFPPEGGD